MATLLEDIRTQSDRIVIAFGEDKLKLDYTVESLKAIDEFFDLHSENGKAKPNGRLSQNLGPILFSIGSYLGETIIRNVPGAVWVTDDKDPQGEVTAKIQLPSGTMIMPMIRVTKRFKEGAEDGIYGYGVVVVRELSKDDYWEKARAMAAEQKGTIKADPIHKKPWWKLW